ncbi:MAG: hypothetical protein JWQ78_611, partial [Sediminibacterium sp.]|nr:hypothetical protein [Sediminibacterium sp.]
MDRKIRWLFIFSSVAFFCFMIILYQQTRSQEATRMQVYNTHTVLKKLERINTLVSETESVTRGYMLTKDTAWKTVLALAHKQLQQSLQEIEELTRVNLPAKNKLPALNALIAKKESYQNELINAPALTSELISKVRSDNEARQITRGIRTQLADMIRDEEQLLTERIAKNEKDYNTGVYFALLGGIFAFFLVLAVLVELNSDIHLRKKAEEEAGLNETKYRNLIENAGVVVFTADANGNITFSNTLVTELTGYDAGELMGKHFSVLVHPSAAEEVATFYGRQFVYRIPAATLEFPTRTKSGDIKWVEQFSQLLYDGDEIIGFQCMVKDITEKKKIESELNVSELKRKENEYRLTAILDNTTTLIFIKDLHGRYIMVNKRFKDVFGLTDEMVINKTDYDFNSIERANHYKELDNQVMATLSSLESEELVETAMGKRNLLLVKFPLLDDKQQVFGISGIATDITERVQSRQELETALSHAREAKELQDQFLANMSHEIRTPLNGIQGMTSLLLETPLDEDQKEFTN